MKPSFAGLVILGLSLFWSHPASAETELGYFAVGFGMDAAGDQEMEKKIPSFELLLAEISTDTYDDQVFIQIGQVDAGIRKGKLNQGRVVFYDATWLHDSFRLPGMNSGLGFRSRAEYVEDRTRGDQASGVRFLFGPIAGGWTTDKLFGSLGVGYFYDNVQEPNESYTAIAINGSFHIGEEFIPGLGQTPGSAQGNVVLAYGEEEYRHLEIELRGAVRFDKDLPIYVYPAVAYEYTRWQPNVANRLEVEERSGVNLNVTFGINIDAP